MKRSMIQAVGAILLLLSLDVAAATSASVEIRNGSNKLKSTLAALPYVSQGKGPILYLLEFSESSRSQQLYQRYRGSIPGVEVRHIFFAVSQNTANETAALAMSRSVGDYQAFMERRKRAKAANSTQQSVDAFNSIMGPVNDVIIPTLVKNGWRAKSLVSPTYFWEEGGKLYADGGYSPSHFDAVLASVTGAKTTVAVKASAAEIKKVTATEANPGNAKFDVLGVHLGMTIAEVRSAFKAYDPNAHVVENTSGIGYYDGVESITIETYISQLATSFPSKGGGLTVDFTRPPEGGRVINIERHSPQNAQLPPYESIKSALVKKYGRPYHVQENTNGGRLYWSFPEGETQCLLINRAKNFKVNQVNYNLSAPESCASVLHYSMRSNTPGGPVSWIVANTVDVSEIVRNTKVSEAWRKQKEAEGRAARSEKSKSNAVDL